MRVCHDPSTPCRKRRDTSVGMTKRGGAENAEFAEKWEKKD